MSLCDYRLIWSANDDLSWARPGPAVRRHAAQGSSGRAAVHSAGCGGLQFIQLVYFFVRREQ
jgi:hypothetical protein